MPKYTPKTLKRFWEKVNKNAANGCWEWEAFTHPKGYGYFRINNDSTGRVHRVSWEIANGAIPDGLCVLHKCDNRACVNPDHLFLGTIADNNRDMVEKGRNKAPGHPGESHWRSRLTRKQVREIRKLYATGNFTQEQLGDRFGVSRATIGMIVTRVTWSHI